MSLVSGDFDILSALLEYRYLTSSQMSRLLGRSSQVLRRRIRAHLAPQGYVIALDRLPAEQHAICLGRAGFELMADELGVPVSELPFSRKVNRTRSFFFNHHTILIGDIRIALSLAASSPSSPVVLRRTISEWELTPGVSPRAPHHERYVLSERLSDGVQQCVHRPDCVFLIYPKSAGPEKTVAFFVEADRNSQCMRRIRQKYAAYYLYWRRKRFVKAFGAVAMRILFIVDRVSNHNRIRSMQQELRSLGANESHARFLDCFRFALASELNCDSAFTKPIWFAGTSEERRCLFTQPFTSKEPSHNARSYARATENDDSDDARR